MTRSTICVDANFVVGLVTSGTNETRFIERWSNWRNQEFTTVAPTLICYEMTNVFHRSAAAGLISPEEGTQFLANALSLGIKLYGDPILCHRALILARQFNLPAAYDAHYLALAERLEAEFWTCDRRLVRAVQTTLPWVNLVS